MTGKQSQLELMRIEFEKKRIPEIAIKAGGAYKQAISFSRTLRDTIGTYNMFFPPKTCLDTKKHIQLQDRNNRSYQFEFVATKNGWLHIGHDILPYLSFLDEMGSLEKVVEATKQALQRNANAIDFYAALINRHPIIGTAILNMRYPLQAFRDVKPNTDKHDANYDPSMWYEANSIYAQKAWTSMNDALGSLSERCSDELTRRFLSDMRKECELLILEACNFSFRIARHFYKNIRKREISRDYFIRETKFPISVPEYLEREQVILNLRQLFDKNLDTLYAVFPLPQRSEIAQSRSIYLPVYISCDDIGTLLKEFSDFWRTLAEGLKDAKSYQFRHSTATIVNTMQVGIQSGSVESQDRLSIRMPAFNVRVDKETRRSSLGFDIGRTSLDHVLACAFDAITKLGKRNDDQLSIFKDTAARSTPHPLEQKMALLASVIMGASHLVGLRKKPTISHHSREFVDQEDYYTNFSHILNCIKEGLGQPMQ